MTELLRLLLKPALMLVGLCALLLALRSAGFDPQEAVAAAGRHGPAAFVALGAIACALAVPRQVVAVAGGYAFGVWPGTILALAAEIIGCAVDFAWARLLARTYARRLLERHAGGRLGRIDRFLSRRTFSATLTLRLLPIGSNVLLNLLAGLSSVAAIPFFAASLIGYVPQTVIFALAGAGAGLSSETRLILAAVLMLASVALGLLLLRQRPSLQHDADPLTDR